MTRRVLVSVSARIDGRGYSIYTTADGGQPARLDVSLHSRAAAGRVARALIFALRQEGVNAGPLTEIERVETERYHRRAS